METGSPPFSLDEYRRRIALTRAAMAEHGIDTLIVSDPSNMAWLTGYDGWSFYVHQCVIVTMGDDPLWWGRKMDAAGARFTVWMDHGRILSYGDDYVQSTSRHAMEHLADVLVKRSLSGGRVGVEMENYYYSAKAHAVLEHSLPNATLLDATALVNWCRSVKSAEEIEFIRKAASITEHIVSLALERAEPGLRKCDLVAEIMSAGIRGVGDVWGDYPAIVPLLPSGPEASAAHLTWNGEAMRAGEATFFELSGCYRRYHAPLCRTVYLGKAPDVMLKAADAVAEGIEHGLNVARAGNRACDIAEAMTNSLSRAGIDRQGRCGYSVGLSYPPDWGERTISIRSGDETVLESGMTLHFMPALWTDDWGLEITETILIQENAPAEALCSLERKLFEKL